MKKAIKIKESQLRELIKRSILRETSNRNLMHMAVPGETDAELEKNWLGRTTAGMNMDDYGNNGDISGFMEPNAKKLKSKKAQNDASWDAYDEVAGIADLYRDNYEDFYDLDKNVNYDNDMSHARDYVNHDAYFVGDDEEGAQEQLQESKLRAIIKEGIQKVLNETSYDLARRAHKANSEQLLRASQDGDAERYAKLKKRQNSLYGHLKDRANQRFNPEMPVVIVSDYGTKRLKAGEIAQNFEVTGYCEPGENPLYTDSKCIGYPKIKDFCGPMWDGDKIRYESWNVYRQMSI